MPDNIFGDNTELDLQYLDETYADDLDTAIIVFEDYLKDHSSNYQELRESFKTRNIELFRKSIHKQKPGFSYVGLTGITNQLQELYVKCLFANDLVVYEIEIQKILSTIESSQPIVEKTLAHLKQL